MRYSDAVASAPAGSDSFKADDLARLRPWLLRLVMEPGVAGVPIEDLAAALAGHPDSLRTVAATLPGERAERLLRLAHRPRPAGERAEAERRVVRALFWPLVYELAPERWDALAAAEPVCPELLAALPADRARVLEVAAGSGRVTQPLAERAALLLAVEPSQPLRRLLRERLAGRRAWVAAGLAQSLPVGDGWADLVVCACSFGPHAPLGGERVLAELERCARRGGTVAFIGPEEPGWLVERGYEKQAFVPSPPRGRVAELEAFFGPLWPPHELLLKTTA